MLTGNLVRVRTSKQRIIPLYLRRDDADALEVAEALLLIFRDAKDRTRGEIESEIDELLGDSMNLVHRGLAKLLEDRSEFETVADVPPEKIRSTVFRLAAQRRIAARAAGRFEPFRRDVVLVEAAAELSLEPQAVMGGLFADLRDEARMLSFQDTTPERLLDRYNVGLAQAVLLKSAHIVAEVVGEGPQRYRQLFRHLKFHRLMWRVEGSMAQGYHLHIDGPLSLFETTTTKYGLQIALFLPALLLCRDFRLDAELRWGPKRDPRTFHLSSGDGLVSHYQDTGTYVPAELRAFEERFRQVAPAWELSESSEVVELGRKGVWVPDYLFRHRLTGKTVLAEVVGFWKRSSLERLLALLPKHGPENWLLLVSDRLKVDEEAYDVPTARLLRFKEIPNAVELAAMLNEMI